MNAAQLSVSSSLSGASVEVALITAVGEIDLTTVLMLREPLMSAIASEPAGLVIDLRRVDFIDSAALALLEEVRKRLREVGQQLQIVVEKGRQPERVFVLGRFLYDLYYTIEDAIKPFSEQSPGSTTTTPSRRRPRK
jgi:anti-anti-sigma factor